MSPSDPAAPSAKPDRTYTKRMTVANVAAAWLAIGVSMAMGHDLAGIVIPLMVTLIAALLGVYQTIGHFDLRALADLSRSGPARGERHSRANRPRDKPEGEA